MSIVQPRKLRTYDAVYRLAARPYALSNVFGGAGRKQFATIHHATSAKKMVKLRNVWVALESVSAAAIVMADLVHITSVAPAGGNPAIVPVQHRPADEVAEATCLALPTTPGTEDANILSTQEWNLGITGAASVANPPPGLAWNDLLNVANGFDGDSESKFPMIQPAVLEGWAVVMDANAAITVKGYIIIRFTEEDGQGQV